MAETTNKVILKIDFDGSNAIQQTVALRKGLQELKDEQAKLTEAVKAGTITEEKAAVQMEVLNAQIKENGRETRTLTKFIDDSVKARKTEVGSIEANRAKLSQLTAEYIKTAKPTKEQTKNIKDLSDKLKEQESAIGDNRRNVGGYKDALKSIGGPIGAATSGIEGFNTTLKANPIILVVSLLQSLFQALGKNAKIADTVSFAFGAINKGFHFIIDTIVTTVSSFDNLKKALTSPVQFIKDLFNGVVDAGKAGFNAAKQLDDFTESNAKLNSEIKLNEIQIKSLTQQIKDRSKSEQERIKIANQIAALEIANSDKQLEKSKQLLEAKKLELKNQELSGEQKAELLELESSVVEAESEKQIAQSQKQTRINILLQKEEAANLKEAKERVLDIVQQANVAILEAENELIKAREDRDKEQKKKDEEIQKEKISKIISDIEREDQVLDEKREIRLQAQKDYAQAEIEVQDAKLSAIKGLADLSQAIAGENATAQSIFFVLEKALAISDIIIKLQREKASNSLYGATNPINAITPGAGLAIAGVQNTAANVRAFTSIALIAAQAIPQIKKGFKDGGYTGDGNISEQSTNLGNKPYTYHKGEYVVPNKVLSTPQGSQYVGILEAMRKSTPSNLSYLGGYADGGFTSRALASNVNAQIQATELANAFRNMPVPVVKVTDIERVSRSRESSINVSEL